MSSAVGTNIAIGVLVLGLVVYRRVTTQRLRENYRLPLILAITAILCVQRYLLMLRAARQEAAGQLATENS